MDFPPLSFIYHCAYGMWVHGKGHTFEYQFVYIQFNKVVPSHDEAVTGLKIETITCFL